MRRHLTAMAAAFLVPLFAVAVLQPEPSSVLLGFAALSLAALICARVLIVRATADPFGSGHRASQHLNVLDVVPAPQHPHTPGRRRARAPSPSVAVA